MKDAAQLLLIFESEWYAQKAKEDNDKGVFDLPLPEPTLDDLFNWLRRNYGD